MVSTQGKEKNRAFISLVNKLIAQGIQAISEKSAKDLNSNTILNKFLTLYMKIYMIFHAKIYLTIKQMNEDKNSA